MLSQQRNVRRLPRRTSSAGYRHPAATAPRLPVGGEDAARTEWVHRKVFARDLILSVPCRKAAPQGRAVSRLAYACAEPCCCESCRRRAQAPDKRRCFRPAPSLKLRPPLPSAVTVRASRSGSVDQRPRGPACHAGMSGEQVLGAPTKFSQAEHCALHDMVHALQRSTSSKRGWWLQDTALLLPVLVSLRSFCGDLKGGVKANYQSHRILTCLTKSARPCQSRVCSFQHPCRRPRRSRKTWD